MTEDGIGVPLRRREDRRFLTGRGRYVHDIVLPQQLHAVFLRSPHAHAEIVSIDKAEALASPGVVAIFTAEDVVADRLNGVPCAWGIAGKDGTPMKEPPHPLLAQGKVRHVGDPVTMVIADSIEAARSAAERIAVEYRILPAVTGVVSATAPGAPQLYDDVPGNICCDWAIGDAAATEAAFAKAHHIAKIELVNKPPGAQRDGITGCAGGVRARDRRLHALYLDPASPCRARAPRGGQGLHPGAGPAGEMGRRSQRGGHHRGLVGKGRVRATPAVSCCGRCR